MEAPVASTDYGHDDESVNELLRKHAVSANLNTKVTHHLWKSVFSMLFYIKLKTILKKLFSIDEVQLLLSVTLS